MARRITTGIDVGSHQVKVVVAERVRGQDRGLPRVLGTGFSESKGLRHGYIINTHDAIKSISKAVAEAEKNAGIRVRRAFVSIGGVGLDEEHGSGEAIVSKGDLEITDLDVQKSLQDAEEKIKGKLLNRRVLHVIPQSFKIDGEVVLGRPTGMKGSKLEAEVLFITCLQQHYADLISVIEEAGIIVEDEMASPIAASLVTLTRQQKLSGCVLANIGSETVSMVIFDNGLPISLKVLPIGGSDITNDIALGLRISPEEAEQIKLGSVTGAEYNQRQLDRIIAARLSDIFELIEVHLKQIGKNGLLPAGIIMTGGGSGLTNVHDLARVALRLPAKVTVPAFGKHPRIKNASWAIAYGLAIWGLADRTESSLGIEMVKTTGVSFFSIVKRFLP